MEALLLPHKSDPKYQASRNVRKDEVQPLTHLHRYILELHLARVPVGQISEMTNYSKPYIYKVLKRDDVQIAKQQIMELYDEEFSALFPEVVQAIKDALKSQDKYLEGAKLWLQAHGKLTVQKGGDTYNITAEDVAMQIINQAQKDKGDNGS